MNLISRDELAKKLESTVRPVLVEALPKKYYSDGHLHGAIRINIDEVNARAPSLITDKRAEIVVYCAGPTCANSDRVAQQLDAIGYENVRIFKGGKSDWVEAGGPIERSLS